MTSRIAKCPHCERWVPSVPYQAVVSRQHLTYSTMDASTVALNDPTWQVVTEYILECPTCICSEPQCGRRNPIKDHTGALLCERCTMSIVIRVHSHAHAHSHVCIHPVQHPDHEWKAGALPRWAEAYDAR